MTSISEPVGREQLTDDIQQTRSELGDTVEALAAKTDVASRARRRFSAAGVRTARAAGATKQRVADVSSRPAVRRTVPPAVIAAALLGTTIVVLQRRRAAARRTVPAGPAWLRRFR